ncbi:MAG: hypothetical protein IIA09_01030 [Proteobacteria bacterium]|nr:hypothetical protein [Pseudomonadota bacterium]
MRSTQELDQYLHQFRLRLKQLVLARGAAMMSVAALLVTLIAVATAIRNGFPDQIVITSRLLLIALLAALAYRFVILPRRRIDENGAADIEQRTEAFGGRVETYVEINDERNPMRELLAEDAARIAKQHPPDSQVARKEFTFACTVATVAIAGLLFLAIAGPGNYAYGVRHLWFGWAMPGLLPPQSIEVIPGDDGIRLGGTVRVTATMQGFEPARAWVHASFGDGEWQQVEMSDEDELFAFTFFSVRQPLEYYVSAANVRSPTFKVKVVDLPHVENLALEFTFPEWTRREPEIHDPGGDVRAIAETRVEVTVRADRVMTPGELIVDDQVIPLEVNGNTATANFTVVQDGQYFVAAKVGGEQIRLTDDYFITLLDDEIPRINFVRPGRDWSASSIEEVTVRVSAEDDFALELLELRYSVNASEWQSIQLPVDTNVAEIDHVFFLESLSSNDAGAAMSPGDLISYYAIARDRKNSARTDIFFIDVQPFNRRYSQSQQSGGMGGQQGGQQSEISDRQREIIVSTWNLIREFSEQRRNDAAYVPDNAALLSRLQATLRGQVETLAQRAHARQLTATDEDIATFAEHLSQAGEAMIPAAEALSEMELEQAILPEQEALQHLLAAEAVFTDISVSLQANNRGRGGQAGRDLTEMFELEMDLEKNQYESGSTASPNAPQQEIDEAADKLAELAQRQERLARNLDRARTATPAQRWQQEMLRRDVEELRDRLERLQQQEMANQSQSQSQSGQQGSQGQQSDSSRELDDLRRRLDSAVRAMNEADEAMRKGGNADDLRRASAEAQRQLEGARDRALEEQQRMLQASVSELTRRAGELYATQSALEDRLQEAVRNVLTGINEFDRFDSGLTMNEEYEIAEQKRRLQAELQALEQDARNSARNLDDANPRAAEEIREALRKLREMEIETRLAVAATYIEQGEAIYIAASESAVTQGLRELRDDLQRAGEMAGQGGEGRGGAGRDGFAETLAATQQLRRALQRLAEGNARGGALTNRGRDDLQQSTGVRIADLEFTRELNRQADDIYQDVIGLFRELRAAGATARDVDELRRLAGDIRASDFSGNPGLLDAEFRHALSLVEQLELALARTARTNDVSVRTNATDEVPDEHKEIVADYYRKLGQVEESANQ